MKNKTKRDARLSSLFQRQCARSDGLFVHGSKSCLNDVESKNQVEKFIQFTVGRSGIHTDTHKTRERPHKTHNVEDK